MTQPAAEYTLTIRHDTLNPNYRLWFHFQLANATDATEGQAVLVHIAGFSKTRSSFRHGMTPVIRSSTVFPAWQRVPPSSCFYYACAAGLQAEREAE